MKNSYINNYKNKINTKFNDINIKNKIRLIGSNGEKLGIIDFNEAIKIADNLKLDLVEIDNNNFPPVYKIMNYNKFIYNRNKNIKKNNKNKKKVQIKEIKLRPNIDKKDLEIKLDNIKKIIKKGNKIKITIKFKGREISHKHIGFNILNYIKDSINKISLLEFISKDIEYKQIFIILLPK